jgi:hypothetical protein
LNILPFTPTSCKCSPSLHMFPTKFSMHFLLHSFMVHVTSFLNSWICLASNSCWRVKLMKLHSNRFLHYPVTSCVFKQLFHELCL